MKRSPLRRISLRRLSENEFYLRRIKLFLNQHPYCQVWLAEEGITEAAAVAAGGVVRLNGRTAVSVPLSTQVHHRNKRRGLDLLDQSHWLAVSSAYHRRIETDKLWARARGYLLDF